MTGSTGHVCPECDAHRAQDGTPSCACTGRASDALREARTTEAAATEDFNPLRIRPYVELSPEHSGSAGPGHGGPGAAHGAATEAGSWTPEGASAAADGPGAPHGAQGTFDDTRTYGFAADGGAPTGGLPMPAANGDGDPASTMQLSAIPADTGTRPTAPANDATMQLAAAVPSAPAPQPSAVPADATMRLTALPSEARATDVRLFQEHSPERGAGGSAAGRPGRRRRTGVIAVAGVVVTMVAAAGVASGLLSYDTPARDAAQPEDVRASVPRVLSDSASASVSASTSATSSASASADPSPSASPSPSVSASDTSASPSGSATSAPASVTPSTGATATGSVAAPDDGGSDGASAQALRRGDSGPEVVELQLRLRQTRMYMRNADGRFDRHLEDAVRWFQWSRRVSGDEPGVYGAATRAALEAETSEP